MKNGRLMALQLLAQGTVVPQVFVIDASTVERRWCAAELDATVHGMLAEWLQPCRHIDVDRDEGVGELARDRLVLEALSRSITWHQ